MVKAAGFGFRVLIPCLAVVLVFAGCGKSESEALPEGQGQAGGAEAAVATPPNPFDMSEFQNAFANADGSMRVFVQEIASTVEGRDFVYGLEQLQKLSQNASLTPEQRQATQNAIAKVRGWAASQGRR
jgi:hypothetical protein